MRVPAARHDNDGPRVFADIRERCEAIHAARALIFMGSRTRAYRH